MRFATEQAAGSSPTGTRSPVELLADRLGPAPVTMLTVWAHPDDESYLGAGLMAEIARRGGTVVNATATLGEHGTSEPDRNPPEQLAARRQAELGSALEVLGVADHVVLGHEDGTCDRVPDEIGARRLSALIDEVRPDVVLGFGPDGVTGHPDHRAVGRWTRLAVAAHGDTIPLLTSGAGAAWPVHLLAGMHSVEAFLPGYPERVLTRPFRPVTLQGTHLAQKLAALAHHESQVGPLHDALGADGYRQLAAVEAYCAGNAAAQLALFTDERSRAA